MKFARLITTTMRMCGECHTQDESFNDTARSINLLITGDTTRGNDDTVRKWNGLCAAIVNFRSATSARNFMKFFTRLFPHLLEIIEIHCLILTLGRTDCTKDLVRVKRKYSLRFRDAETFKL